MMNLALWIKSRRLTLISIGVGTVTWLIAFGVAWMLWPVSESRLGPADRLVYAAQLLAGVGAVILAMVSSCFRVFESPVAENPFANAESARWKTNQRVLSNTVEQTLVFVPALLALAVRVDPAHIHILPILTTLWCAGRLMFWFGYRISWKWRGPGFEWTLYSSMLPLGWFAWTLAN